MYYYSSVESGETCVRASRAAAAPAPRAPAPPRRSYGRAARAAGRPHSDSGSRRRRTSSHCRPYALASARAAMELLCAERVSPASAGAPAATTARAPPAAAADPVLLRRRVLDNLLRTEERYAVTANYFGTVQTELTPHMRRLVAEWMLEVRRHTHPRHLVTTVHCEPRVAPHSCSTSLRDDASGSRMLWPQSFHRL